MSSELSQLPAGGPPAGQDLFYTAQFDSGSQTYVAASITGQQLRTYASRPGGTNGGIVYQNSDGYEATATGMTWDDVNDLLSLTNPLAVPNGTSGNPAVTFGYSGALPILHGFYAASNSIIACIPKAGFPNQLIYFGFDTNKSFVQTDTVALDLINSDAYLRRAATGVLQAADIVTGAATYGYLQTKGQLRVNGDVTSTSTAMANVPGLSATTASSRTYTFEADLIFTDAAAGGIQVQLSTTSTGTFTVNYDGWILDGGGTFQNRAYTQATSLGTPISSLTTGTLGHAFIKGTVTTSAVAGPINVQFAQNTSSATQTIIKNGSFMFVHDMP